MAVRQVFIGLAAFLALTSIAAEPAAPQEPAGELLLENEFIRAKIAAKGGNLVGFEDRVRSVNHARSSGAWAGLGKVRMFEDPGCTEFLDQDYDVKVVQRSGSETVVECTYVAKRKDHPWRGFEVIKRYSLKKGENRLCMEWMINSLAHSGELTPFMHNYLRVKGKSYAFAQTAGGLFCREIRAASSRERTRMVRNLSEPWGAVISPETQDGILGYDAFDATREMLFWFDETQPTIEPVFETARFGMNSSWSNRYWFAPLRDMTSCHFASADYAGGFCTEKGQCLLKFMPFADIGKVTMKIFRDGKLLDEFSFDAEAGKTMAFSSALGDGLQKVRIEIGYRQQNRIHEVWVSPLPEGSVTGETDLKKEENPGREYAKCTVPKGKMFVTPDMTVPLGFFAVTNKLSGDRGKTVKLFIDVPEGITLTNPIAHYGNCHNRISGTPIRIDGQPYVRYEIPQIGFRNTVFASTVWPAGRTGTMYYQLKWQDGEDERKSISVESLAVPRAPFPRRLITNIPGFGMLQKHIDSWPGFYEAMRHVGCNTISSSGSAVRNGRELELFFRKAQSEGFYTFANCLPFHRADKFWVYSEDIRDFCAVSLTGKDSSWPCPSYRGKAFLDHVEQIASPGKYGATMLALDTEMWSGADYCYCKRCLKRFEDFLAEKHPDMEKLSPLVFRNSPEKYPEHNRIWNDFKAMLGCEMYREIVGHFQKNLQEAGTKGPYLVGTYDALPPGTIYSMFLRLDDLLREKLVNHVEPSPYTRGNALKFAESVRAARKAIGNSNVLTWMSAGGVYNNDEYPGRDFRYCLLENFANGARGYLILPWYGLDAEDLKEHATVMQMIVPVEDIVLEGEVMEGLKTSSPDVKICGLRKGSEQLILLSEYYDTGATPVSFDITSEEDCRAVDMLTGEVIASLGKGVSTVHLTIPADDRAVLIYVGNRALDFSGRPDAGRRIAGKGAGVSSAAPASEDPPLEMPEGILVVDEGELSFANGFYKITFFKNPPYSELEFTRSSRKVPLYLTSSLRYEGKPFSLVDPPAEREIRKSADGKTVEMIFRAKFTASDQVIRSRIVYTFRNDRPVIGFSGEIALEPSTDNCRIGGSLNTWWFKPAEGGALPMQHFRTGPLPEKSGLLADQNGGIEAGWKKKYKYFALCEGGDAFGMITPSQENASIYVSPKKNGYITGSRIRMKGSIFQTRHWLYAGPEADLAKWAEKLYASPGN